MKSISGPTSVYVIMVLVFGVGLWVILDIGSMLHAPPDLAGQWQSEAGAAGGKMTIEQSGRFLVLTRDGRKPIDVKLVEYATVDDAVPARVKLTFAGGDWHVVGEGPPGGDTYRFRLDGPAGERESFVAHRVRRKYPLNLTAPPTTAPATGVEAAAQPATTLHARD